MIPTARSVDAVGIAVPDLDEAVAFLCDVVGCVLLYRAGPFSDRGGDWMARHLGVDPALVLRTAMLRCGPTLNVELLEWSGGVGDGRDDVPGRLVAGAQHLAFYVDDLDHAAAYLAAVPGVRVLGRPTTETGESSAGEPFVLARSECLAGSGAATSGSSSSVSSRRPPASAQGPHTKPPSSMWRAATVTRS